MSDQGPALGEFGHAGDDAVVPFQVEALDLRGRAVQLGDALDTILVRHDYPEPVSRLLAEAIVLTVLLGSALKFEGKFIFQSQSDGPVDMMVVDFATPGSIRAYARFEADAIARAVEAGASEPQDLLGKGVLAMTVDQGVHMQRYQGIVQLDGGSLEDIARIYFRQSEQIPTEVRLSVARHMVPGQSAQRWRAGGVLVQFLPEAPERLRAPDLPAGDGDEQGGEAGQYDDAWNEALALLSTIEPGEIVDPTVGSERLLYRLFHEHGVRVYPPVAVSDDCSCSRERIRSILDGFSAEEIVDSVEDGAITVSCEFCSKSYSFDPSEFDGRD